MAVKSSGDISAELVRGQKIEEHAVTDLDLRNDETRRSLTSSAAEERQDVSSKNTIDEMGLIWNKCVAKVFMAQVIWAENIVVSRLE